MVKTKIIATLGPASSREAVLRKMFIKGLDVVRLNFSHGIHHEHLKRIHLVRLLNKKMRRRTKAYLFSKVKPQGFAIMEISPEFKQGWRGFDKLDYPKLNTPVNQQTMELFERIQILQKREMVRKKGFFRRGRSKKDITDSHINISA